MATGYYKMPEKTAEDFFTDDDGVRWFKTGDIGQIDENGTLRIVDRKKDLVKLQFGEYISLGKVEAELKTCPLVENICIYGDSTQTFVVALIVPDRVKIYELAKELGYEVSKEIGYGVSESMLSCAHIFTWETAQ